MPARSALFQLAIQGIDQANSQDPNLVEDLDGTHSPKERLYSQRMSQWLAALYPDASEALALAVHAQHICRWQSPRSDYPEGRQGYKEWRTELGKFHAETAAAILKDVGYDDEMIAQTKAILRKEKLKLNPETQRLEDIACLVFLQFHLDEFVEKYQYNDEKILRIIRKTWKKMSPEGHQAAATIPLLPHLATLVQRALNDAPAAE